jgi:NAD(P)-dependent dehydrogenase (short-subunit alcohol dehydrogenase family)
MANEAMNTFGKINILVNNAGARVIKGFLEHTKEDWDTMLGINLSGPFYCSQAIAPKMIASGGGSIINVCSIASYMGRPNRCAYVAAKSGLLGLTRTMAIDLAPKKIRVNGISPGMIASPFNQRFSEGEGTGSAWANDNLVGRWGNPEDINGAVVFLASNESSFITGSDIKVEGGWLAARARVGEESITSD